MTSPETPERTAAFFWPGFTDMATQPAAHLHNGRDGIYSVIEFGGGLSAHLHTTAQCDALIKAAVVAKDVLLAAQAGADTEAAPGDVSSDTAGIPANHIDNAGHATLATGPAVMAP